MDETYAASGSDEPDHGDEHALLAAAFASLPDAIVAADLENRVRLVNPAAEALLGVRESEILRPQRRSTRSIAAGRRERSRRESVRQRSRRASSTA